MCELPRITGGEAVRAFEKAGFELYRIRGSHHILKKQGHRFILTVPVHGNQILGIGLLGKLIKSAGLTKQQFLDYL